MDHGLVCERMMMSRGLGGERLTRARCGSLFCGVWERGAQDASCGEKVGLTVFAATMQFVAMPERHFVIDVRGGPIAPP